VTGLSVQQIDLGSKRIELLREVVRNLRRLAVMANVDSPDAVRQLGDVEATVKTLDLEFIKCGIRLIDEIGSIVNGSLWQWPRAYRQCTASATMSRTEGSCRRGRISRYVPACR
jgi:hypothetical protein